MFKSAKRLDDVHSDIRGPLYEEALKMEKEGIKVLKLNTGNPGKFGFTLPVSVRNALMSRLDEAVPYCDVRGMKEAREAILAYHQHKGLQNIRLDDIYICNGVSEAVSMLTEALVDQDDEILMPSPCYSLWSNSVYLCNGKPVFYRCDPDNEWNVDLKDLESKINKHTKAILIINPNNPTGAIYQKEILLSIGELARKHHLILLADEIYDRLVLEGEKEHESIAALLPDIPCVTFNGLSKSHIVCGFRCGWMVFSGNNRELDDIQNGIMKIAAMRLCSNALTQLVIPDALNDGSSTREMMNKGGRLYEQSHLTYKMLKDVEGVDVTCNKAAFYLFPGLKKGYFDFKDANDFCMQFLHQKHILVIPGTGFDWDEDIRFRIVMLPNVNELKEAMIQLIAFLDEHRI